RVSGAAGASFGTSRAGCRVAARATARGHRDAASGAVGRRGTIEERSGVPGPPAPGTTARSGSERGRERAEETNMKALLRVERDFLKKRIPEFSVGDTVKVHVKVVEGDKVRNQIFQGTVIGRRGGGVRETFTVRKISSNVAVERTFPLHSPNVVKIERIREGRVRRAQLTY